MPVQLHHGIGRTAAGDDCFGKNPLDRRYLTIARGRAARWVTAPIHAIFEAPADQEIT